MPYLPGLWIYSFTLALLISLCLPSLHLIFFAPFLVVSLYRCSLTACLWWAIISGLMVDLFSSQIPFGFYAANYCLTVRALYRYQQHFFEDRPSTLPLMSVGFVLLFSIVQAVMLCLFSHPFEFSWEWIKSTLVFVPMQNALYAGIAFRGCLRPAKGLSPSLR